MGGGAAARGEEGTGEGGRLVKRIATPYTPVIHRPTNGADLLHAFEIVSVSLCIASVGTFLAFLPTFRRTVLDFRRAQESAKRLGDLPDGIRELEERIDSVERSLKRLHSRAGMREVRERRAGLAEGPDWRADPDGFRRYWESRIAPAGGNHADRR